MGSINNNKNGLALRRGTLADAGTILHWVNDKALWQLDDPSDYRQRDLHQFAPVWAEVVADHAVWIVQNETDCQDAQAIGQLGWIAQEEGDAEVFITLANSDNRRKGFGRWAMSFLEEQARTAHLRTLRARVLQHNRAAQKFFYDLGFSLSSAPKEKMIREGQLVVVCDFHKTIA